MLALVVLIRSLGGPIVAIRAILSCLSYPCMSAVLGPAICAKRFLCRWAAKIVS